MAKETDDVLGELRALKMFMILQLLRQGTRESQTAAMLGVSERTMGRMLPKGIVKGVSKGGAVLAAEEVE